MRLDQETVEEPTDRRLFTGKRTAIGDDTNH